MSRLPSEAGKAALRECISTRGAIRRDLRQMIPAFPPGAGQVNDRRPACGAKDAGKRINSLKDH